MFSGQVLIEQKKSLGKSQLQEEGFYNLAERLVILQHFQFLQPWRLDSLTRFTLLCRCRRKVLIEYVNSGLKLRRR